MSIFRSLSGRFFVLQVVQNLATDGQLTYRVDDIVNDSKRCKDYDLKTFICMNVVFTENNTVIKYIQTHRTHSGTNDCFVSSISKKNGAHQTIFGQNTTHQFNRNENVILLIHCRYFHEMWIAKMHLIGRCTCDFCGIILIWRCY